MNTAKRIIAAVILLAMAFPCFIFSASAKEVTVTADGINVFRDSGYLVIYTSEMGETTNTNEWGYEVIIEDNVAVSYNKGNSAIPKNGFVLSGHDQEEGGKRMGQWIKDNIAIGDYVYYNSAGVVTVSDKPVEASVFYELTRNFASVGGTRYENTIVIYNNRGKYTGTNDWGYEVVCEEGIVVSMGGNNNLVPSKPNSFVVSAHGSEVTWLQENIKIGMSVSYDSLTKKVTFAYDETAAVSGMELKVKAIKSAYDEAVARYDNFDYENVKSMIDALEKEVSDAKTAYKKNKNQTELVKARDSVEANAKKISLALSESRPVEYRGVWIRPTDTSKEQVEQTVQTLYDNGINMICIETLYDCTMIMPMPEDSLFETNPKFRKFDMLQCYIDACHARGMELHLWLPIYYVGDSGSSNLRYSLGKKKPEWLSVSNTGKPSHQILQAGESGSGLMMLDPSNEEATNYLLNTYKYILETYDVDGFQMDYIRYFNRGADYDMGYTEEALDAFEEKYGVRPKYDMNASYWKDWVNFRCEYINNFVQRLRKLIDETRPGVLLGADVVPDPTESVQVNYQNYYNWLENKWIDILFPMSYGYGHEEAIADQSDRCGSESFLAVGLGIFMHELTPDDMHSQAVYNNSVYADGSVYFEASSYLHEETGKHLLSGIYRTNAITPTFDIEKAAKAQLEFMKSRVNDVILANNGVSASGAEAVSKAIDELITTVTKESFDTEKFNAVKTAIANSGADEKAVARMTEDLMISVKAYTVLNKEFDMSGVPDLPDTPDYTSKGDETETPSDESTPATDESESEKDDKGGLHTDIIIVIIAGVVALAAVVVGVVVLKKKGGK
ncbi:MAG: hypothetical protein E7595_00225 [Ruminococcaceae bacterium]|nr:hypothetical protein [Oscillospiraceae bacterium]